MGYDYFVASQYRNQTAVLDLVNRIRGCNRSVYCFFESDGALFGATRNEDPEVVMREFESLSDWRSNAAVRSIFEADMNALRDSDNVILLLPAGKSSHVEAGIAYGLGKNLILIGDQQETESLYLIFHEVFLSVEEFAASVRLN